MSILQGKRYHQKILHLISQHRWFSGRMLACHAGGPGSIPGRCNSFIFIFCHQLHLVWYWWTQTKSYFLNFPSANYQKYNNQLSVGWMTHLWPFHYWIEWEVRDKGINRKSLSGDGGYRSPYLSHAKRALYHLSYVPYVGGQVGTGPFDISKVNRVWAEGRVVAVEQVFELSAVCCPR